MIASAWVRGLGDWLLFVAVATATTYLALSRSALFPILIAFALYAGVRIPQFRFALFTSILAALACSFAIALQANAVVNVLLAAAVVWSLSDMLRFRGKTRRLKHSGHGEASDTPRS